MTSAFASRHMHRVRFRRFAAPFHPQEDFAAAKSLFERSLDIREKALGREHPDVARSLDNVAAMLEVQVRGDKHVCDRLQPN